MTGRERELAAIRHECTDRVPVDVLAIEPVPALALHLGISEEAVYERLGIDGRVVSFGYYLGEIATGPDGQPLTPWGTVTDGISYDSVRAYPMAPDITIAQIERYAWPDPAKFNHAFSAKASRSVADRYAVRGPTWTPLFDRVCDLIGMEEAMIKMLAEPEIFEAILENVFTRTYEMFRGLLEACGDDMPIFTMGDDFATQRGMMIPPDAWRRMLKPRYAKIFDMAKRMGKYVWFHSCGDITPVLGDLIDIGMDVWETVQLHTLPISPTQLKRDYGKRVTFFGGVNTQRLPFATPEQVAAETRQCIEALGPGGGYICGPDHHVKHDVPAANTVAVFDTATAFRQAGITL